MCIHLLEETQLLPPPHPMSMIASEYTSDSCPILASKKITSDESFTNLLINGKEGWTKT